MKKDGLPIQRIPTGSSTEYSKQTVLNSRQAPNVGVTVALKAPHVPGLKLVQEHRVNGILVQID